MSALSRQTRFLQRTAEPNALDPLGTTASALRYNCVGKLKKSEKKMIPGVAWFFSRTDPAIYSSGD